MQVGSSRLSRCGLAAASFLVVLQMCTNHFAGEGGGFSGVLCAVNVVLSFQIWGSSV